MSEDSWPGLVDDGATGQLVAGGGLNALLGAEAAGAPVGRDRDRAGSPALFPRSASRAASSTSAAAQAS